MTATIGPQAVRIRISATLTGVVVNVDGGGPSDSDPLGQRKSTEKVYDKLGDALIELPELVGDYIARRAAGSVQ